MNTPYLAFVATKDIPAWTEFTFDYDPSAADVKITSKGKSKMKATKIPPGAKACECGSVDCRGYVRVWVGLDIYTSHCLFIREFFIFLYTTIRTSRLYIHLPCCLVYLEKSPLLCKIPYEWLHLRVMLKYLSLCTTSINQGLEPYLVLSYEVSTYRYYIVTWLRKTVPSYIDCSRLLRLAQRSFRRTIRRNFGGKIEGRNKILA